jgi:hypothetical protein
MFLFLAFLFGGLLLSRMFPPPSPADSPEKFAHLYGDHLHLTQLGFLLMVIGAAIYGCWSAAISVWVRRMEGDKFPVLTYATLILMGAGTGLTVLGPLLWSVAAYRAGEVSGEITQTLNDIGWFLFLFIWPLFSLWGVAIAIAIFRDQNVPRVYPRWLAYVLIWSAISSSSASAMGMFKTGPMAYNGFVSFWIPAVVGAIWFLALTVETIKTISREELRLRGEEPSAEAISASGADEGPSNESETLEPQRAGAPS